MDAIETFLTVDRVLERASVLALSGANFSGRSALLRKMTESVSPTNTRPSELHTFIGIDSHNYISGLLPTVHGELSLHGIGQSPHRDAVHELLSLMDYDAKHNQNPLTLSGGEQVVLALGTALLSTSGRLAIDCSLEQLSPLSRQKTVKALSHPDLSNVRILLADNRLREFASSVSVVSAGEFLPHLNLSKPIALAYSELQVPVAAQEIELEHIEFSYSNQPAIPTLSYRFEPGHIYVLKGPNGIGKSTLAKLLGGLIRPSGGSMRLGANYQWKPWKEPGEEVAYHFQNPDLQLFSTRVAKQIGSGADDLIDCFGMRAFLEQHPQNLPFVLRKRVALCAAMARRRPWLILDEPILGQDDENASILSAMLEFLAANGCGIIVITHSEWFEGLFPCRRSLTLSRKGLEDSPSSLAA